MVELEKEIKYVKGVGPSRAEYLEKLGIHNLEDLITYYPRNYEDRGKIKKIAGLVDAEEALVEVVAVSRVNEIKMKNNMRMERLMVRDETGTMMITWFNQSYLKNKFEIGIRYKFFGKVSTKYGKVEMKSPVMDIQDTNKNTGKIIPIYPSTQRMPQSTLRQIIENGLQLVKENGGLIETIPNYIKEEYKLEEINKVVEQIHFPKDFESFEIARKRLVFEELLSMQLALISLKNKYTKEAEGITFDKNIKMSDVINDLPFQLTRAQTKVLEEVYQDMENTKAMNRLLQGDVGSRKNNSIHDSKLQSSEITDIKWQLWHQHQFLQINI